MHFVRNISALLLVFCLQLSTVSGQFSPPEPILSRMSAISIDQIDGIGSADFVSSDGYSLRWFSYDYEQQILLPRTFSIDTAKAALREMHITDLDGDGDRDYVGLHDATKRLAWLEKVDDNGTLKYHTIAVHSDSSYPSNWTIRSGDVDQNGLRDLIVTSKVGNKMRLYVYRQINANTFEKTTLAEDFIFRNLHVLDMDGDGDLDIFVTASSFNDQWIVYENDLQNNESWTPYSINNEGKTNQIQVKDINQDGWPDIFQINTEGIYLYEGISKQAFTVKRIFTGTSNLTFGDLDGNGFSDILLFLANGNARLTALMYDGTTFTSRSLTQVNVSAFGILIHDFNEDGRAELIISNNQGWRVVAYDPDTDIYKPTQRLSPQALTQYDLHDLDGDTDLDVIVKVNDGLVFLENIDPVNQSVNLVVKHYIPLSTIDPGSSKEIQVNLQFFADKSLDSDAELEILCIIEYPLKSRTIYKVLHHQGAFDFSSPIQAIGPIAYFTAPHLVDLDQDGLKDVVSRDNHSGGLKVLRGRDDGKFEAPRVVTSSNFATNMIASADMDLDGDPDILFDDGRLRWLLIDTSGNGPVLSTDYLSDGRARQIAAVDIDMDGNVDLIKAFLTESKTRILINEGDNTFELGEEFTRNRNFVMMDLDYDGWQDMVVSSYFYRNRLGLLKLDSIPIYPVYAEKFQVVQFPGREVPDFLIESNNVVYLVRNKLQAPTLQGRTFYDKNQNGIREPNEYGLNNVRVDIKTDNDQWETFSDENGLFRQYDLSAGSYRLTGEALDRWDFTTDSSLTVAIDDLPSSAPSFGYYPKESIVEGSTYVSIPSMRCNQTIRAYLSIHNTGTVDGMAVATLQYDSLLNYKKAIPLPTEVDIDSHTLTWQIDELQPLGKQDIRLEFQPVSGVHFGKAITFKAEVNLEAEALPPFSQQNEYSDTLRCAFDPNDKLVSPNRPDKTIQRSEPLIYTIRFQNTGNDTAFQVLIRDTLTALLDSKTIRPISASHPYSMQVNDNIIEFLFQNILLPDSTTNLEASMGYVQFAILPKGNIAPGDQILNRAAIYFDLNEPIITNTTISKLEGTTNVRSSHPKPVRLLVYPNPSQEMVTVELLTHMPLSRPHYLLLDGQGRRLFYKTSENGRVQFDVSTLPSGIYLIRIQDDRGQLLGSAKLIK